MPDELVRAKNVGAHRFDQYYANRRYVIEPGDQTVIPWDAMVLWTGNPGMVGDERGEEVERLHIRYGKLTDTDPWEVLVPRLQITDLDGEKIVTVLEDPDGAEVAIAQKTVREQADLERVLGDLQAQQERMKEQLRKLGWKDEQEEPLQDEPKSVAVGQRRGRVRDGE